MLSRLLPEITATTSMALPTVFMVVLFVAVIAAWMLGVPRQELDRQALMPLEDDTRIL